MAEWLELYGNFDRESIKFCKIVANESLIKDVQDFSLQMSASIGCKCSKFNLAERIFMPTDT